MKIIEEGGVNTHAEKMQSFQNVDTESKNFQNQIANAQKRLKELASDNELSAEEKAKKRQEIQKQITELNNQLRQHQIEMRREQQEKEKSKSAEEMSGEEQGRLSSEEECRIVGMSQNGMRAIISANTAISHAKTQGHVNMSIESRMRVLQSEIRQDTGRGENIDLKQSELKNLEDKALRAKGAKMEILDEALRDMKKAATKEIQPDNKSGEEKKGNAEDEVSVSPAFMAKKKTDAYVKGKMFSNMDIHI